MKIRNGFISNSSSTSFTMCFDGDENNLYEMLKKYGVYFELIFPYNDLKYSSGHNQNWGVDVEDVIKSIKSVLEKGEVDYKDDVVFQERVIILDIEDMIKAQKYSIEEIGKQLDEVYDISLLVQEQDILDKLETAKRRGLTSGIVIDFGDNHGVVCGGRIGNTMDYAGRYTHIDKKDFIVYTEQNR